MDEVRAPMRFFNNLKRKAIKNFEKIIIVFIFLWVAYEFLS